MVVKIVKDKEGLSIGWTMEAVEDKDITILNTVRHLQFFGFDQTAIEYNGRKNSTDTNVGTLEWIQNKHQNANT